MLLKLLITLQLLGVDNYNHGVVFTNERTNYNFCEVVPTDEQGYLLCEDLYFPNDTKTYINVHDLVIKNIKHGDILKVTYDMDDLQKVEQVTIDDF